MADPLTIIHGDALSSLRTLDSESVQCVVTSPPYWGLRDYGVEGQLGLEKTPEEYVERLADVFVEIKRVLRADGAVFLNLGDSYSGASGGRPQSNLKALSDKWSPRKNPRKTHAYQDREDVFVARPRVATLKPKDLIGVPWMVAFALRANGWYLRSEIIWAKPAPMPESVRDRPTRSHEQIFLFTKSGKYFYNQDAVRQPLKPSSVARLGQDVDSQEGSARANGGAKSNGNFKAACFGGRLKSQINDQTRLASGNEWQQDVEQGANLRDVWWINAERFSDAHFAVFPEEIPRRCIMAGSQAGDVVLDPFAGSGTTGKVAIELGRKAILIEPKAEYVEMIKRRCQTTIGLPLIA